MKRNCDSDGGQGKGQLMLDVFLLTHQSQHYWSVVAHEYMGLGVNGYINVLGVPRTGWRFVS